jgi:carbonic anhydrase
MRRITLLGLIVTIALPLAAQTDWDHLKAGNDKFIAGTVTFDGLTKLREELRAGQHPRVTVLACADSRVPPELVFAQTLGEIFVVRTAGSVADTFGLASIEYAVARGYTNTIVVLGHDNCGAVRSALAVSDDGLTPSLLPLLQRIRASFVGIPYEVEPVNLRRAVEANTRASVAWLLANSLLLRKASVDGKVTIVPAYYDAGTGAVTKLD